MANPVYHVTFTKDVADIQKRGLDPLSQSLWEKAETGERYQQDPSVYGFSDPKEALNWATKMAWEFEASPSDISILTLEGGDHWQKDPSGDLNLGQSAQQSLRLVEPSEVLDVFSLPEPVGTNAEFQEAVPGGDFEDWKDFYSKRLGSRPPDQSNLPPAIGAAAEASRLALPPDDEPRPKGLRKGIGSLKRAPWFALAQMAWEHLSPEQKEAAAQCGKEAYGSLENAWEAASAWSGRNRFPAGGEGGLQWVMDHLGFEEPPDTGMADGGLVDNLSNVSFDINDPFANPEEYEEANPYSLGVLGLAASIAAGPFSPIVWGIRGLQAYNFAKSQGWLGEEEPQYTGPVNPQTHEIDVINVTEEEANPQFSQAQVSLAPAQGAESELGDPPPDPTVDPTFGSMGTPPSGSDGAGDGTGEGAASAAADSPAGSPWNTGGFVVKPLYDS